MALLPPAPINSKDAFAWADWQQKLRSYVAVSGVTWTALDKTGSNITDIVTRQHNTLQSIQGGAAGDYNHLTSAQLIRVPQYARKTADQSITSNTVLANDTHLSQTVGANEEWICEFVLDVGAALATTGMKLAITTPVGATLNADAALIPDVVATTATYVRRTTTSGTALDFTTATLASVGNGQVRFAVWVLNGANAGTINLQIAQSTSSGTALTFRKGSYMTAFRIA